MNAFPVEPETKVSAFPSFALPLTLFLFGWWGCFLFYPLWYIPSPPQTRPLVCALLYLALIGLTLVFKWMADDPRNPNAETQTPSTDRNFFYILFFCVTLLHLPFLTLPVLSGLDTIDHAAVPALIADQLVNPISRAVGVTVVPFLTTLTGVVLLVMVFHRGFRQTLRNAAYKTANWIAGHLAGTFSVLALITAVHCFLISRFMRPERFGDIGLLFRYPPLSKMILIPLYAVFGLQEWVGRGSQILFTYAGAIYLHRLTQLFGGLTAARVAAILFVLLPPIFHYGNTDMIDCGTLFFTAAVFYHYLRYLEKEEPRDLIYGTLFGTFGCLYKHPLFSVIPAFSLMILLDFIFPKGEKPVRSFRPPLFSVLITGITVFLYMKLSSFNSDVPSRSQFPLFWENWKAIPVGVTWPLALGFGGGLLYLLVQRKWRCLGLLLCWIGTHSWMVSMVRVAGNVRQSLPYYLALMVAFALALESLLPKRGWIRNSVAYGVLPAYLVWAALFMDLNQDYRAIGRPMGDRSYINFLNWDDAYVPYDAIMNDLRERIPAEDGIYAPMVNEPSHFYRAKYHLLNRRYLREIWEFPPNQQTLDNLYDYCRKQQCRWLLVPRGRWLIGFVDLNLIERLFTEPSPGFQPVKVYVYGKVQVGLWKIVDR